MQFGCIDFVIFASFFENSTSIIDFKSTSIFEFKKYCFKVRFSIA